MDIVVAGTDELDAVATGIVAGWLGPRPVGTILPALGTSALGVYRGLGRLRAAGALDTSDLRLVQLDEYLGVARDDRRSLRRWLARDVATPLAIPDERIVELQGDARDPAAACRMYVNGVAAAGGIGTAILGLGPNGHLGFNEPPSAPDAPTRVVPLAEASIESNARYWGDRSTVPRRAITAGMDVLLRARRTLLVVSGPAKRGILRRLVTEPVSADLPATFLRTIEGVTLVADRAAWPGDVPIPDGIAG